MPDAESADASDMSSPEPAPEPAPATNDPYSAWRSPNFGLYAGSWFLMTFGRQIEALAIGIYIYDRTHQPLDLGWVGLVQALPVILLAIPGGNLADRFDRRRILAITLTVNTLIAVGLMFGTYYHVPLSWIYLLLFFGACSAATGGASRAALLPQIVTPERFPNAVTWNSSVFQMAMMTGPAIGGLLVGLGTERKAFHLAFAAVVLCRILSLAGVLGLRCPRRQSSTVSASLRDLSAGVRFVWNTRLILAPITLDLFAVLFGGATYLLPVFAEDILHITAWQLGVLRSAEAVGAVTMAMLIAHLPPMRRAGRTLLWAVAGFGAATIIFGFSTSFYLSLAMMFLIGAFDNVSVVVRHTLVQMLTPDHMRGRVSAVNNVFIVASNDLGGLESGFAAWAMTPVLAVVSGGIGTLVVVLSAARLWPEILALGSLKDIRPADSSDHPADTSDAMRPDEPGEEREPP